MSTVPAPTPAAPSSIDLMRREIRSWGYTSLILGAVHLVAAGYLSPSWGVTLIIVGLFSFYFRAAAMFVVYAVSLGWVGLSNALESGFGFWTFLGLYQIYLSYRVFTKFGVYRGAEADFLARQPETDEPTPEVATVNRTARLFPWLAVLSGVGGILTFLCAIVLAVVAGVVSGDVSSEVPQSLVIGGELAVTLSVLALSLGLAGWVAGFRKKPLSIIGTVAGGLLLVVILYLSF